MLSDLYEGRRNIFREDKGGIPALRLIFLCKNVLNWN